MKIIQLLVTLQRGDAIGNFTISLHELLLEHGYHAEIYAYNIGDSINNKVANRMEFLRKVGEKDLVIYHMCEGHRINEVVRRLKCKKIAVYHNTTPPEFFSEFGVGLQQGQESALKVIASMKNVFTRCIADSEYNKQDLAAMGYQEDKLEVIPIMIDFDDYKKCPDGGVLEKYKDDFVNILFVGRLAPNKKQEDIIRIFAYYHNYINKKSRLFLIGSPFIKEYDLALREYISFLELDDSVIMPGHSTFSEILAYYSCADVFLCMSEHEGFCVPLIEAMLFDVPIIAYHSTAIPHTLAGSGIIVGDKDPQKTSILIDKIVKNDNYAISIVEKQRERLKYFNPRNSKQRYMDMIIEVLGENI